MALLYTAIAVVMTWPLAARLGQGLAADLGDPAFSSWVLAWTSGQLLKAIGGDVGALSDYWNGNIFHPEPLTLAYSEHLTAQAIQILPIYAATGNIMVAYNLLIISTFALSGFAVYLLVRELTDRPLAAFLAGLAFAYAPYRFGHLSHVQVLSSYWMPLALLGLHKYFTRVTAGSAPQPRLWALAGAATALVMQHLSCGYYMLFFAPFVAAYCLFELTQRRLALHGRVWCELGTTAAVVAAATWPFVEPYFAVRELAAIGVRSMDDIVLFSADTHAFVSSAAPMIGRGMTDFFKAEGDGFPGFTTLLFATIGLIWSGARVVTATPWSTMRDWHFLAVVVSAATATLSAVVVIWLFVEGQLTMRLGRQIVVFTRVVPALPLLIVAGATCGLLLAVARRRARDVSATAVGFFVLAALWAALLALGPHIEVAGRRVGPGPYRWLLDYVPGFDGLRVPARMLMLVSLFLSVLAGLGAAALSTRFARLSTVCILAGIVGLLFEGWMMPVSMNVPLAPAAGLANPQPPMLGNRLSPVYAAVRALPDPVVLVEFPFGDPAHEPLAVFHAGYHRRALVNGYSGFVPQGYEDRLPVLRDAPDEPERLLEALADVGTTHVLVHEGAFRNDRGRRLTAWLRSVHAREVAAAGTDRLFALK
jgi:hypothetical protein